MGCQPMTIRAITTYMVPYGNKELPMTMRQLVAQYEAIGKIIKSENGQTSSILVAACEFWGITRQALAIDRRTQGCCLKRWMVYRIMRDLGYTLEEIGSAIPKGRKPRDHGTVLNGLKALEYKLGNKPLVRREFEQLKELVEKELES